MYIYYIYIIYIYIYIYILKVFFVKSLNIWTHDFSISQVYENKY